MSAFGRGQVGRGLLIGLSQSEPSAEGGATGAVQPPQGTIGRARTAATAEIIPGQPAPPPTNAASFGRGIGAFGRGVAPAPISSVAAPVASAAAAPAAPLPAAPAAFGRGFGRGFAAPAQAPAPTAAAALPEAMGRMSIQGQPAPPPAAAEAARPERPRRPRVERVGPENKQGTAGQKLTVGTNFLRVDGSDCIVYQYNIQFNPNVDSRPMRDKLVLSIQDPDFLQVPGRVPSGNSLYTNKALPRESGIYQSSYGNTRVSIRLELVGTSTLSSLPSVYNIIFRSIQARMDLVQFGRHYFNPHATEKVQGHNMEVWPGYITSVSRVDGGLRLMVESNHRVVRTQTVYELFQLLDNKLDAMTDAIVGASVVTRYNNRMVRIDQIDTSLDATCTFERHGAQVSFQQYYKEAYNITVSDPHQPLLISRAKPTKGRDGKVEQKQVCLVPELCYTTGLTDDMRRNFHFMKDLAKFTKLAPDRRLQELRKFVQSINKRPECRKLLDDWGLRLCEEPEVITARRLVNDAVRFGSGPNRPGFVPVPFGQTSEFKRALADNRVLIDGQLKNWLVIYPKREERTVSTFFETMMKKCRAMGITASQPNTVGLPNDSTVNYLQAIRQNFATDLDLVCTVFTSQREERYNAVKKLCCTDLVVPTQCLWTKTIGDPKKMGSVAVNVAAQINVKLGGALWGIDIPYERFMMMGIDVYHADKARTKSVTGIVASVDQGCTRWYSRVAFQKKGQEILDSMRVIVQSQLLKYMANVGALPSVIYVYRDGVSDKQIAEVQQQEVPAIYQAIQSVDPSYKPRLVFVVVQKRINQRIFLRQGNAYANPPPGTVLDHSITRPDMMDFFLVPQHVTQGTVTPTHYILVECTGGVPVDEVQQLTFRSCHLYYNWAGSIRVPAPCQYAHKLVYMVGQNITAEPSNEICDRLFYL